MCNSRFPAASRTASLPVVTHFANNSISRDVSSSVKVIRRHDLAYRQLVAQTYLFI